MNLYTIDILEIEIDNHWISFKSFLCIVKNIRDFDTYEVIEKIYLEKSEIE